MKSFIILVMLICCTYYSSYAQVGIGTTNPDDSSILHIESTNKGVLIPRLTTTEIGDIANPATGLLVFNTDLNEFQYNYSTASSADWSKISYNSSLKYSNSNTTTNLNAASYTNAPIFGNILWNDDTSIYSVSGNSLTINSTGRYKVVVNISYRVPTLTSNADQRVSVEAQLAIDGVVTGAISNTGYVRHANNHLEASLHLDEVLQINSGQTISVQTIRGGNSAPAVFRSVDTSNFYIEKIK